MATSPEAVAAAGEGAAPSPRQACCGAAGPTPQRTGPSPVGRRWGAALGPSLPGSTFARSEQGYRGSPAPALLVRK